jgi:hypothetical protein
LMEMADCWRWRMSHIRRVLSTEHDANTSASVGLHYIEGKQHSQMNTNQSNHSLQENKIQSQESNKVRTSSSAIVLLLGLHSASYIAARWESSEEMVPANPQHWQNDPEMAYSQLPICHLS